MTSFRKRKNEQTCTINGKHRGGGEPEGCRRTERRVVTGWEGRNKWSKDRDRDSGETKLNVLFSILVRSTGTGAGTTAI